MDNSQRISAVIAYIPVIGWLYVLFAQRRSEFAMFHLRQSIGLVIGALGILLAWAVFAWVLDWIPFGDVFGIASFTLVITVWIVALIALVIGLVNAARGLIKPLPFHSDMKHQIRIHCQTTALAELRVFLQRTLGNLHLSEKDQHQLTLAVEEVCANLIIHSHKCNEKDQIDLEVKEAPGKLIFEIKDQGEAFNLLDYEIPDLKKVIGEKRKGGLGIILVKKIMDEIEFESSKGTNTCRLIKWFRT